MNLDPRPAVIARRLDGVGRLIAVTGGKGGIGKSVVSSCLALSLARQGARVGLLDLDFTGPCDHLILGLKAQLPAEDFGLIPPEEHGLRFMSVSHLTGGRAAPLRGGDVSNALIELLAVVRWGPLDWLVIDLPPGLGDVLLDAVRLLRRGEFVAVATASTIVVETVARTLELLTQVEAPVLGVIENMRRQPGTAVAELAARLGLPFWGFLPYDPQLEPALGTPAAIARTEAYAALTAIVRQRLAPGT